MATEVSVPVRLKVLQESITSFQKILDNLQPDTKNWRDLNRLISSMTADAQKLQAQLSKPFSSQQQFNSTEKTIDKLEEAAARVSIVMQGLKFSDIKLTPAQTQELQKFDDEINKIRESYKQLQEEVKEKLLSDTNTSNLIGNLKGNVLNKSFSEIESAVDTHINNLKKKVDEKNQQYEALLSNKRMGESATQLVTNGLSAGSIGSDLFDKFLRQTEKGFQVKTWNAGVTKQALLNAIGEMYHLEPGELQKKIEESLGKTLNQININDINKWFSEKGAKSGLFSGITQKGKKATADTPIVSQDLESLRAQLREYELIAGEIARLTNTNLAPANGQNEARVAELTGRLQELQAAIFGSSDAMNNYKSGAAQMQQANTQLRNTLQETNAQFLRQQAAMNSFNAMKNTVANFMGFYQVLNLTKQAIKEAANHIKELDSVMNKISIVTNMDTSDLWGQIDQYSAMAQRYGTTIKGAYEVSQIYYQQGLETADVLTLTNETLKLAKISGLDYASTTDYMTTAIRGFKMEMQEAATVVDVYSALAANTAVSQEELAVAMSKTASSMESVGSTFEETSAMIATMVAVTRESATNIGSAMKSIASRYGELTKDPTKLVDSEGEAMAFNKVDTALQSVGISMKTAEGQFREFTDVIVELGEKWAELDSTQQRYIATQFAGNRQQSRFLALVSNIDLLKQNIDVAENSEDIGTVQALKTLDSLESKIEQVRVAYQQFYTTIGVENVWKGFLDGAKNAINMLNGMPKLFGKIPVAALNTIAQTISLFKNLALSGLAKMASQIGPILSSGQGGVTAAGKSTGESWINSILLAIKGKQGEITSAGQLMASYLDQGFINNNSIQGSQLPLLQTYAFALEKGTGDVQGIGQQLQARGILTDAGFQQFTASTQNANAMLGAFISQAQVASTRMVNLGNAVSGIGQIFNMLALVMNSSTQGGKQAAGAFTLLGGAIQGVAAAIKIVNAGMNATAWYAIASAIVSIVSGVVQLVQANSLEAQLEEVSARAEELSNKAKELKSDYNTINNSINKLKELEETRYDSAEAAEEYQTAVDKLAEAYPALIKSYDINNKAVIEANDLEQALAAARQKTAEATFAAAEAEVLRLKKEQQVEKNKLHTENDNFQQILIDGNTVQSGKTIFHETYLNGRYFKGVPAGEAGEPILLELTRVLRELETASEYNRPEEVLKAYEKLNQVLDNNDVSMAEDLQYAVGKVTDQAYKVLNYDESIKSEQRTAASYYMNKTYGADEDSIFSSNKNLLAAASDVLYDSLDWNGGDYSEASLMSQARYLFGDFDNLYKSLGASVKKQLDQLLEHPEKYTENDLLEILEEAPEWLQMYFSNIAESNATQFKEKLKSEEDKVTKGKSLLSSDQIKKFTIQDTSISALQQQLLNAGFSQAKALSQNNQNATPFIEEFMKFYENVSILPTQLRNSLIEQFMANGFTKEGMTATLDWIKENEDIQEQLNKGEVDLSSLETMVSSFIPNYSLTVATLEDQLTTNLDDIESLFSDLQNGVNGSKLGKTIAKAEELGLHLDRNQFEEDGEKFVLRYTEFANLISGLDDTYKKALPEEGELEKAYQGLTRIDHDQKQIDISRISDIQKILGSSYYNYFDANDQLQEDVTEDEVYDAIETAYTSTSASLTEYNAWLAIIKAHLTKIADWKHGNYTTLEGKVDLTQIDENGQAIDTAYKRVQYLAAHPEAYTENELKEADVSNAVDIYQKGLSSLLTDLSKYGVEYLANRGQSYEGVAESTVDEIRQLAQDKGTVEAIRKYGNAAAMSIEEINKAIINSLQVGKGSSVANMISGRTTNLDDINKLITDYKIGDQKIESFLDGNNLIGPLSEVYDFDALSGELTLKNQVSLEQVLKAYSQAFGISVTEGTALYDKIKTQWITDFIANEDKNDPGKQMASAISSLASAKVGTRIDLSKSPELQVKLSKLGYDVTKGYYEVTSEYARDSMLLQLEGIDEEVKATLKPLQDQIKQKRSKSQARLNISGITISSQAYDTFLEAAGINASTMADSDKQANALLDIGYKWDENLQLYVATTDAITKYDEAIADAIASGTASKEYIQQLREKRGELAAHFRKDEKRNTLSNLLSNYEDAAGYIDDLYTQFGEGFSPEDLKEKGVLTETNGKQIIDVNKLQELVSGYDDLFTDVINQIADEYINNIAKAGSLLTQGTSSTTEMSAFEKAYMELTGESTNFFYDSVIDAWTISATDMRAYIEKAAASMNFASDADRQDYINAQIKAFTIDNIDFSKYLSGSASVKDQEVLERNLKNYYEASEIASYDIAKDLKVLSTGGITAIEKLQSIKGELTTEEIEAAYRAQIAPIKAIADSLNELRVNSVVAKNQIEILRTAGFSVDENGVITAVGDMVAAYKSIYAQMKATGEATTAELNAAFGAYLDNRDREQAGISALQNATNMTYSQFAQIFTDAGIELTETMFNSLTRSGIIKALGGNKMMITDFEAFARRMDWSLDSEEYINALSAYRDGIISYDKKLGDSIKANFDAISNAKVGDQINLTQLLSKFPEFEAELETVFGDIITDGILTVRDSLTLPQLAVAVGNKAVQEGGMLTEELEAFVASIHDNILEGITTAFGYSTSGTNSIASMQAFTQEYNNLTGKNKNYSELFGYDTLFNTFKLNSAVYQEYLNAQRKQLESVGLSGEAIDEYIKDQTVTLMQQNMDIESFLNAQGTTAKSREANKLAVQIVDWMRADEAKLTDEALLAMAEQWINQIEQGGTLAVDAIKAIKGENATASELEAAFNNSQIVKLRTAMSDLGKGVGETVTGLAMNIMQVTDSFELAELDDGSAVITAVGDMVQAYANLYAAMKSNADATTGDLNSAYAKLLTAADQKNIDTLDVLENAAGMTYDAFAEILTRYDKSFEDVLSKNFVESTGFGKVRITNFEKFAAYMDFDINSPEYAEAYNAYIDSMIALKDQPKQTIQNMAEEIKSLANAKIGDNINVADLARNFDGEDSLRTLAYRYGAKFKDGILSITEQTDIPGLMAAIANEAAAAGQMIPEQLAEIADAIESMLSNIVSLLGNGLSGNLSNTDAQTLSSWASQHGVELNFTKTAEGLRISNEQAYQLYQEINKIDALQGQVAFQQLKENLIATKDEFKTASANIAYIKDLENQISTLRDKKASPDNEQRIAALEEELALAKQINLERSTSADDSFNFMSNDIPAAQNNPLNYYKNWSEAIKTLNTAMKTSARDSSGKTHKGLIDYTDFYNIVTEMNNLARIGGDIKLGAYTLNGDLESAAKLIDAGAKALTTTDTGDIAVSLGDIGIDFKTGSGDMSKGIQDGIKAMADSQVDMLDGLIQLLETIVAMESLSDIDVDGNGIDLSELFTVTYDKDGNKTKDYTPIYKEWREDIITKLDDYLEKGDKSEYVDLGKALTGIKIGGISLDQIIRLEPDELLNADKAVQQAYTAVLTAFTKAAQSNNYNLDDIAASVRQELASAGVFDQDLILDIGNSTLVLNGGVMTQINWNTKDNQALLQQVQKDLGLEVGKGEEEARKAVAEAMSKYQSGQELNEQELTWTATVNKHLKVVDGNSIVTWNGNEYTGKSTTAALAAWRLRDAGVDFTRDLKDKELESGIVETETTIGNVEHIKVKSNGITIEWYGPDGSGPYTSKDALLKSQYETYVTEQSKIQETSDGADTEILSYEQWVWANYHYHIKTVSTTFTVDDKAIDLNTNREARDAVRNMYDLGAEQLQEMISQDSEGNYVLTYKGITVKFDKETVETDGVADGQKIANELWSQLGLDTGLADTITEGITNAIPKFTEALSSLNTTEPTGLTSWSEAITAIGTAAEIAASAIEKLVSAMKQLPKRNSGGADSIASNTTSAEFDSNEAMQGMEDLNNAAVSSGAETGEAYTSSMADAIQSGEGNVQNATSSINTHLQELGVAADTVFGNLKTILATLPQHVSITGDIKFETPQGELDSVSGFRGENGKLTFTAKGETSTDTSEIIESVEKTEATANVDTKTNTSEVTSTIASLILPTVTVPVEGKYIGTKGLPSKFQALLGVGGATGNFGLAKAAGTLMGELGPELVVQNGRYFIAGQNGAEFVNLQDDAIVFNHLQTEQLLKKGMSSTRGRAVTNERTAVAFAQGNINGGPAMASASAALAALKQLRSMWASLASASVQDLAGAGGGGGGGGGDKDMAAYIKELEKWYNWLQKIAELEDKINYQEQLRSTISSSQRKNGSAYYSSLKDTLKNLQEQVKTEQSLIDAQQKYFDKRRKELNTNGPFNSLYTFDENGQLKYKKGALNKLSKLNETDKYGKPKMSSEEQYSYIVNTLGIDEQYLQTTATGEAIDTSQEGWQATAVQAFWDKMDADKEEMQSLHDSINEHSEALLAAQEQQNEILQEMRDNQLAVEQNVYDAIVDSRERAIEDAEAMRDALEESTTKFIDGLSSALDKERSMYEMQESQTDLDQKRRRLAILQRTGGSNSEITSLQSDIASSERDLYFDKQQEQIDLIQEASDKQIEKLDQQIELDRELLEYQKAHGLLWSEVADIMKMDSAAITDFITSNNSEWWAKSPVQSAQDLQDAIFQTDQWVEFRDDQNSFFQNIIDTIYNTTTNAAPDNPTSTADSTTQLDNNGNGNDDTTVKYKKIDEKYHNKITTKKDKNGKKKKTEKKEKHDFDSNGKCTKCGYKKKKTNGNGSGNGNGGSSGNEGSSSGSTSQPEKIVISTSYKNKNDKQHIKTLTYNDGSKDDFTEAHKFTNGKCICGAYTTIYVGGSTATSLATPSAATSIAKGETLDQSKIDILRASMLEHQTASLSNLQAIVADTTGKTSNSSLYTTIDREKSTQIGSISLNMDVKQIANDYDAKRAGEKAMEEMLRIARKSTTATVRR